MSEDSNLGTHEIERWLKRLNNTLDTLSMELKNLATTYVLQAVYLTEQKAQTDKEKEQDRRIAELEDGTKWLVRTVFGIVLAMVITGALIGYFGSKG